MKVKVQKNLYIKSLEKKLIKYNDLDLLELKELTDKEYNSFLNRYIFKKNIYDIYIEVKKKVHSAKNTNKYSYAKLLYYNRIPDIKKLINSVRNNIKEIYLESWELEVMSNNLRLKKLNIKEYTKELKWL